MSARKFAGQGLAGLGAMSLLLAVPQPVGAQIWIGEIVGNIMAQQDAAEKRHLCLMGEPMPEDEVTEAYAPTNAQMQAYFAAMQSGSGKRSDFFALDKKARWQIGDRAVGQAGLDGPDEPFSAAGNRIDAEPVALVRSGWEGTSLAQWRVHDSTGRMVGTYTGFFVRKLGNWQLRELTLVPADKYAEPVRQYCFEPGDVMPYRLEYTLGARERAERELAKAQAKLEKLAARLAKSEAKLAEKPESSSRQDRAARNRADVNKWAEIVTERQGVLTQARNAEREALADAAAQQRERDAALSRIG